MMHRLWTCILPTPFALIARFLMLPLSILAHMTFVITEWCRCLTSFQLGVSWHRAMIIFPFSLRCWSARATPQRARPSSTMSHSLPFVFLLSCLFSILLLSRIYCNKFFLLIYNNTIYILLLYIYFWFFSNEKCYKKIFMLHKKKEQ